MRTARTESVESNCGERFVDPPVALDLRHPANAQPVRDVLRDAHVRKERIVLEDGVDVAVERGKAGDVPALQQNGSDARELEARDHPQHRGLAGARRSEHREELAFRDVEVDARHRGHVPELLGHSAQRDRGAGGHRVRRVGRRIVDERSLGQPAPPRRLVAANPSENSEFAPRCPRAFPAARSRLRNS